MNFIYRLHINTEHIIYRKNVTNGQELHHHLLQATKALEKVILQFQICQQTNIKMITLVMRVQNLMTDGGAMILLLVRNKTICF